MTPAQQAHQRALEDAALAADKVLFSPEIDVEENAPKYRQHKRDEVARAVRAYLASLSSQGYKVTPQEPTSDMISALDFHRMHSEWHTMHDAFQWPPEEKPTEDE